jgi:hypothetical protein
MKRMNVVLAVFMLAQLACTTMTPSQGPGLPSAPAEPARTILPLPATAVPEPTYTTLPLPATAAPEPAVIPMDALKNFTYRIQDFDIQAPLQDGTYSDGEKTVTLIEPVAFGDINGDGVEDAGVVLAVDPSGSGTFYDLVVLLSQDGLPVQVASTYIGDRQGILNLTIVGGRIALDYFTQGPSDPLCCPSQHRLRSYILEGEELHLASEQILDSPEAKATPLPDAILIDQPADMAPLTSPMMVRGRVSQMPPSGSLSYFVKDSSVNVLASGEINVAGEPGGAGTFEFEFSLTNVPVGILQIEVIDGGVGALFGRTVVMVLVQ